MTSTSYADIGLEAITAPRVVMALTGAAASEPSTAWGWVVGSLAAAFGVVGVAAALKEEADLENLPARELAWLAGSETETRRGRRAAFEGRKVRPMKDEVRARYIASEKERYARALERKAKRELEARARKATEIAAQKEAAAEVTELIASGGISRARAERAAREMTSEAVAAYLADRERLTAELKIAQVNAETTLDEDQRAAWVAKVTRTRNAIKGLLHQAAKTKRAGAFQEYEDPGVDAKIRELILNAERERLEGGAVASEYRSRAQHMLPGSEEHQALLRRAAAAEADATKRANRMRSDAMKCALPYVQAAQATAMYVITSSAGKFTEEGERLVREELATEAAAEALYALVAPGVLEPVAGGRGQKPTKEAAACFKKGRVGRAIVAEAAARASYKGKSMTRHKGMSSGSKECPYEHAEADVEEALQSQSPGLGLAEGGFDLEAVLEARRAPWTHAFKRAVTKAKRDAVEDIKSEYENMLRHAEATEQEIDLEAEAANVKKKMTTARLAVEVCARKQLSGAEVEKKGTVFGGAVTNVQLAKETGLAPAVVARLLKCGERYLGPTTSEAPEQVAAHARDVEAAAEAEMRAKRKARVPREFGTLCERELAQKALPYHQRETPLAIRAPVLARELRGGSLRRMTEQERIEAGIPVEGAAGPTEAKKAAAKAHKQALKIRQLCESHGMSETVALAQASARKDALRRYPASTPIGRFLRTQPEDGTP